MEKALSEVIMLYYQKDRLFFWIGSSSVIDIRVVAVTRFLSYIGNQHFKLLVLMGKVYEKADHTDQLFLLIWNYRHPQALSAIH